MRVVVCTKETPDTAAKVEVSSSGEVTWGDAPLVINPWDEYTVEEGLRLKENHGATAVTVLAVGGDPTREALKHAIAMGCDEAVLVSDPALAQTDSLLLSRALAGAIGKLEDTGLVMLGKVTTDGNSGQTAAMVGRRLGWNTLTFVSRIVEIDFGAKTIKVERLLEQGKQVVEGALPAVISVVKEINEPRYPSFMGIRKASKAEIPVWSAADVGVDGATGPLVTWQKIYAPPPREGAVNLIDEGSVEASAEALAARLIEEKVI